MKIVTNTKLPVKLLKKGKVRDMYDLGDKLLMVATDRISAFDVVFPNGIPLKGACLNQISLFWFDQMKDTIDNHIEVSDFKKYPKQLQLEELKGRSVIVKKTTPMPVECVVRGYLAGSAWRGYKETGQVCGIALRKGMRESERFDEPLFTPSTKAVTGHDENISMSQLEELIGEEAASELEEKSMRIYSEADEYANKRGIILADTKFEFGTLPNGKIILIDELLTPDSSRFWPVDKWTPGSTPECLDKEYLRQYLLKSGWNREPPAPVLPESVVNETSRKYVQIFEKLTGGKLDV